MSIGSFAIAVFVVGLCIYAYKLKKHLEFKKMVSDSINRDKDQK